MRSVKLVEDTISREDIDSLCDWLKTYPRLTKGELTVKLEKEFAHNIGTKHSVFVNSGSSAILLGLYCMKVNGMLKSGDRVIVPALSWATDYSSILQLDLVPVICDCDISTLSLDENHLKSLIKRHKPKALLLVSVLGLVPDMKRICEICNMNNMILLEDCCESLGSSYTDIENGWDYERGTFHRKLGTFGYMSFFSTYFGHHISTIEGGFICTDDDQLYKLLLMLRSHGWKRDINEPKPLYKSTQEKIDKEFTEKYTFHVPGFNLRSTDLQAFIGIRQIKNIENNASVRNRIHSYYVDMFRRSKYAYNINYNLGSGYGFSSNFAFPIICYYKATRNRIIQMMENRNIECRPLICGSMSKQPMHINSHLYSPYHIPKTKTPNANFVHEHGMYLPIHQNMTIKDVKYVVDSIDAIYRFD